MATSAEKLASNLNFSNMFLSQELRSRLFFTLIAVIIYRLGTYIPIPGVNAQFFVDHFSSTQQTYFGILNVFSGGAVSRLSIFSLGIVPYISASIFVQLASTSFSFLSDLKKMGEKGQDRLTLYTRILTVIIASLQGYAIVHTINADPRYLYQSGFIFTTTALVSIVGGTFFLIWFADKISSRGVANGTSLLIWAGILAELPMVFASLFSQAKTGVISFSSLFFTLFIFFGLIVLVVFVERAQRKITVQYPRRQVGNKMYQGELSYIPLKVNTAGVLPAIITSTLLTIPLFISSVYSSQGNGFVAWFVFNFSSGRPLYIFTMFVSIIFFSFFLISLVSNSEDIAKNLKNSGAFIPGVRPGEQTVGYLSGIISKLTVFGSLYLAFVVIIPQLHTSNISYFLGGTTILILVNVTMDIFARIQGFLFEYQYESLLKKTRLR